MYMEDVLDLCERPYDEKTYQLLGEPKDPLSMRLRDNQKLDSEYVRHGTCSICVFTKLLTGWWRVSVREHRTVESG